jgi:NADH dehydrogenase
MRTNGRTQIVILGGGFGGVYTAMHLEKRLRRASEVDITLVNRDNFFLFTPMLHEVAASDLDITHIVNPLRKLLHRTNVFEGEVASIDLPHKRVCVSHGSAPHQHELPYDHLVLALGSITNFFNLPGLADHALTMKTLGDAIHLRNRLIANLEEASAECAVHGRAPLLSVVVAGGGFAGVETVAAVNDFLRESLACYPSLSAELLRIVLVHPGAVILPELSPKLGAYAQRKLAQRGVEIHTNTKVTAATAQAVTLSDGTTIPTRTLVWTAGTSPNPLLATLPCATERGRLPVHTSLEVPEWPGVWALGDCALIPDRQTGTAYPPTAQHALREGKVLAHNIIATLRGGQQQPFVFSTLGQLAAIGKRTGVANILGVNFSGFLAWWLWRTIYLSKLPRLEKKLRVMVDWTLDLLFTKDLVQFMPLSAPVVSPVDDGEPMPSQR